MITQDLVPTLTHSAPARDTLRGHIRLLDPVTWVAGPQGVICGALASGVAAHISLSTAAVTVLGIAMSGPLGIGFSQSINDYFDRRVDADNDPSRPIPAGEVSLWGARFNFGLAALLSLVAAGIASSVAHMPVIFGLTLFGLMLSIGYSVPPMAFKRNGLIGPLSVGLGYNLMTWVLGYLLFAANFDPTYKNLSALLTIAAMNTFLGAGLLILNDIKSEQGDRLHGVRSLPVIYGVRGALSISFALIDLSQTAFVVLMAVWGHAGVAAFGAVSVAVQMLAQRRLWAKPTHAEFKRYLLSGNGLIVLESLLGALAVGFAWNF